MMGGLFTKTWESTSATNSKLHYCLYMKGEWLEPPTNCCIIQWSWWIWGCDVARCYELDYFSWVGVIDIIYVGMHAYNLMNWWEEAWLHDTSAHTHVLTYVMCASFLPALCVHMLSHSVGETPLPDLATPLMTVCGIWAYAVGQIHTTAGEIWYCSSMIVLYYITGEERDTFHHDILHCTTFVWMCAVFVPAFLKCVSTPLIVQFMVWLVAWHHVVSFCTSALLALSQSITEHHRASQSITEHHRES